MAAGWGTLSSSNLHRRPTVQLCLIFQQGTTSKMQDALFTGRCLEQILDHLSDAAVGRMYSFTGACNTSSESRAGQLIVRVALC